MAAKTNYEIIKAIENLKKKIEEIMPSVNQSIDTIIGNDITSCLVIERLLDQLLDYTSLGLGEEEFRKLNKYYATINKENASFYEKEFDTFYSE